MKLPSEITLDVLEFDINPPDFDDVYDLKTLFSYIEEKYNHTIKEASFELSGQYVCFSNIIWCKYL